ncbi:serine hydrolase domain-containing protein [Salinisphaera sp.]|uniref:serine hydrolase domain-containing protein n=1 Tax=Salinisphaera sp. TaxID=1914330 RepID=UPI002D774C9F|nr:serine hydrolase domain-containing protein [Salinisphaera sp.]HET7313535.1 serine hydrolase domain-containing protein [Salinisphaera sp.]
MSLTLPGTRRIAIEEDPADLVRIDRKAERAPHEAGLSAADVEAIGNAMIRDLFATRIHPAVTFCLRRHGAIVLNRSIGYARGLTPERPLASDARLAQPDTPVCLFSASKAVVALLTHKLAEEGGIDLDAPVSRYLPAFSGEGKSRTTISQVLSHQGGFPHFTADDYGPEMLADWEACVARICAMPAEAGGRHLAYHSFTGGFILGEVIRRVTGAPLTDYLDTTLRKPLGMRYFTYGLDGRSRSRAAENHVAGQPVRWPVSRWARRALSVPFEEVVAVSNRDFFMDAVIPAGNLYATAEELSRFYQMLLDGGVYRGQRLFEPATLARVVKPASSQIIDRTLKVPMRYTEGLMLGMNPIGMYGPMCGSAYGHLGFMNILGWADPARGISAALMTTGKAILGGHLVTLLRSLGVLNHRCRRADR